MEDFAAFDDDVPANADERPSSPMSPTYYVAEEEVTPAQQLLHRFPCWGSIVCIAWARMLEHPPHPMTTARHCLSQ